MVHTVREVMTGGAECVAENETVLDAARKMARLGAGALPICGDNKRLKGIITDRDIVVKVLAHGDDPSSVTAGSLGQGKPVTIGADDTLLEALQTMAENKVRRLPVIDGHNLVGMLSQGDLAKALPPDQVGHLVEAISED